MEYLWKETEELGDKERFLLYALHTFLEGNKQEGVGGRNSLQTWNFMGKKV